MSAKPSKSKPKSLKAFDLPDGSRIISDEPFFDPSRLPIMSEDEFIRVNADLRSRGIRFDVEFSKDGGPPVFSLNYGRERIATLPPKLGMGAMRAMDKLLNRVDLTKYPPKQTPRELASVFKDGRSIPDVKCVEIAAIIASGLLASGHYTTPGRRAGNEKPVPGLKTVNLAGHIGEFGYRNTHPHVIDDAMTILDHLLWVTGKKGPYCSPIPVKNKRRASKK